MLENMSEITYRGDLKSCNYQCTYCPFAKNNTTAKELEIDEENWNRFVNKIKQTAFKEETSILIAPYGEALIHDYYTHGIAELTKEQHISKIGVQTNLSLDPYKWIDLLKKTSADLNKVVLWCTYHPSMTNLSDFTTKITFLSKFINLSVGVVGNPDEILEIKKLRDVLPVNIYLWINSMDGLNRTYTKEEIHQFTSIDPMFMLELTYYPKDNTNFCNKNHLFIKSNGDLQRCNRIPSVLGNLYKNQSLLESTPCSKKRCDCYLAYSHLTPMKELDFFGGQAHVRVPKRLKLQALFLDVDGTLTDKKGRINEKTKRALAYISQKMPIYLVTELPYQQAMKKCQDIKGLLSGGCFANGGYILENNKKYEMYYDFPMPNLSISHGYNVLTYQEKPYKILIRKKLDKRLLQSLRDSGNYEIITDKGRVTIVSKGRTKLAGIRNISKEMEFDMDKVMAVGNSYNDLEMLSQLHYSAAVFDAPMELKKEAKYILDVHQLAYMI